MTNRFVLSVAVVGLVGVPAVALVAALAGAAHAGEEKPAKVKQPADAKQAAEIRDLIRQLDDDDFEVRTSATDALQKLGATAAPALRQAVRAAESEEIRWRAEQLLMRLEGAASRPLKTGPGDDAPEQPESADQSSDDRAPKSDERKRPRIRWRVGGPFGAGAQGSRSFDEMYKAFEAHMKQLDERIKKIDRSVNTRDMKSLFDGITGAVSMRAVAVPGLQLQQRGPNNVELRVTDAQANASAGATGGTYAGTSLEDILVKHPSLRAHASMAQLQDKLKGGNFNASTSVRDAMKLLDGIQNGTRSLGIFLGKDGKVKLRNNSVSIEHNGGRIKVRVVQKDEAGAETVTEAEGADMDEIVRNHPELKELLGGVKLRISAPQLFTGNLKDLRERTRVMLERTRKLLDPLRSRVDGLRARGNAPFADATPRAVFGISAARISASLAAQLGLAEGEGALVESVLPGSTAASMGLQQYDILLRINAEPVQGIDRLRKQLSGAGEDDEQAEASALTLEILRAGKRQTLTR